MSHSLASPEELRAAHAAPLRLTRSSSGHRWHSHCGNSARSQRLPQNYRRPMTSGGSHAILRIHRDLLLATCRISERQQESHIALIALNRKTTTKLGHRPDVPIFLQRLKQNRNRNFKRAANHSPALSAPAENMCTGWTCACAPAGNGLRWHSTVTPRRIENCRYDQGS